MEVYECGIIGGGAAGLSAALYLGVSLRKTVVFDNDTNRNRVTRISHAYLTRDGETPASFRTAAKENLAEYANIDMVSQAVQKIDKNMQNFFILTLANNQKIKVKKLILATGIQEIFPENLNITEFYGQSIYSCPYCDGWEIKHQPLIVIAENDMQITHIGKLTYNWSQDIVVASNGHSLNEETIKLFQKKKIKIIEDKIEKLHGENGLLRAVTFESGETIERSAGFIVPSFKRTNNLFAQLDCSQDENQQIITDGNGRTNQPNVYVAGEYRDLRSTSLLVAAAEGSKAAIAVNMDLIEEIF